MLLYMAFILRFHDRPSALPKPPDIATSPSSRPAIVTASQGKESSVTHLTQRSFPANPGKRGNPYLASRDARPGSHSALIEIISAAQLPVPAICSRQASSRREDFPRSRPMPVLSCAEIFVRPL